MLITKMRDQAGRPVKQIEFMTPHLIVYNMERLDDGTIIDGKFGLVEMMDYYIEDGSFIPFGDIEIEEGCLTEIHNDSNGYILFDWDNIKEEGKLEEKERELANILKLLKDL